LSLRAVVVGILVALALSVPAALFLGTWLGPLLGFSLVGAVLLCMQSGALSGARDLSRKMTAASALVCGGLALLFLRVLVANPSDNAYLWIAVLGYLLVAPAVVFGLATIMPVRRLRQWLSQAAVLLLWVVGVPGAMLLAAGSLLAAISGGGPGVVHSRVVAYHLIGLLALLAGLWLAGYRWPRTAHAAGVPAG
jgi:hypothetical protein